METKLLSVLLVDDDEDEFILLKSMFAQLPGSRQGGGYTLSWASTLEEATRACQNQTFDLYLLDYFLGRHTGLDVMHALQNQGCNAPYILLTGQGSYEIDVQAMQRGAADYLLKDQLTEYVLERSIRYSLERKNIHDELELRVQERTQALLKANEHLRESEERFRRLTETTSAAIFIVQDKIIRYTNPAARFITGYPPEALLGMELWRIAHPAYQYLLQTDQLGSQWAAYLPSRYEIKIINRAGEERWLDVTAGSVDYDGHPAWLLTAFDITERDLAERELQKAKDELEVRVQMRTSEAVRRAEELDGLHRATSALLSTLDLDMLLKQILLAAQSAIPAAEKGLLFLIESPSESESGDSLIENFILPDGASTEQPLFGVLPGSDLPAIGLRAWLGYENDIAPDVQDLHCVFVDRVMTERTPLRIDDLHAEHDVNGQHLCPLGPAGSLVAAPLLIEDAVLGVLGLVSSRTNAFNAADEDLLVSFAITTTAALQNALLYAEVLKLASGDPVTGKYNRRAFFELGRHIIEQTTAQGSPLAAIMIDLDNFKIINDTYGHPVGDEVLHELSLRFRAIFREQDLFGRYGGDEFALLLPGASQEVAAAIGQRILEAARHDPILTSRGLVQASLSVGIAHAEHNHIHIVLSDLLRNADRALYKAKRLGKNRLHVWQSGSEYP